MEGEPAARQVIVDDERLSNELAAQL